MAQKPKAERKALMWSQNSCGRPVQEWRAGAGSSGSSSARLQLCLVAAPSEQGLVSHGFAEHLGLSEWEAPRIQLQMSEFLAFGVGSQFCLQIQLQNSVLCVCWSNSCSPHEGHFCAFLSFK